VLSAKKKRKSLEPEIVFEDDYVFLVNKPAGWVTLRVNTYQGITLQDWVEKNIQFPNLRFLKKRGGLAHRLDKDTWGLVLGAKRKQAFNILQAQFKKRLVKKKYLALLRGELKSKGKIVSPIGRLPYNKLRYGVVPDGKEAETEFEPVGKYIIKEEIYTLVKVGLKTGRTHQIRVHFKHLGHPVYGDCMYGGKKEEGKWMFLIAKEISFLHPEREKEMEFEIGLPKELKEVIINAKKTEKQK